MISAENATIAIIRANSKKDRCFMAEPSFWHKRLSSKRLGFRCNIRQQFRPACSFSSVALTANRSFPGAHAFSRIACYLKAYKAVRYIRTYSDKGKRPARCGGALLSFAQRNALDSGSLYDFALCL